MIMILIYSTFAESAGIPVTIPSESVFHFDVIVLLKPLNPKPTDYIELQALINHFVINTDTFEMHGVIR